MAFKLAELFCEFTTRGVESVQKALGTIHKQLEQVQTGSAAVGRVATLAFSGATLALGGFVRQGIGASAVGDVLHFQMERLSRTIAGLFGPEIRKVIDYISQLNERFAQLTDQQRENIVHWIKAAAAGLAMAIVLPRIIGGINLVVGAMRALSLAMSATGIGGILVILGAIVTALAGMGAAATVGEGGIGALTGSFQELFAIAQDVFAKIVTAMEPVFEVGQRLFEALKPLLMVLGDLFVRLAETIAPVVAVIGELLIPVIQYLTWWIGALSSLLGENTGKWLAAIATFVAVILMIRNVIDAIKAIIVALKALTIAQVIQQAMAGPAGWASLAAGAAIAAAAVGAAALAYSKVGDMAEEAGKKAEAAGKKSAAAAKGGRGAEAIKIAGFESIEAAYNRIALASMRATAGGKSPEERQIDKLEEIRAELVEVTAAIDRGQPLWNR